VIQLYHAVNLFFNCYTGLLIMALLSSWFPDIHDYSFIRFVHRATEPYLRIFRRFIPPIGFLDISPIAAFFALGLLETIVKRLLFS
jgi:YggT family protein